MKGGRVVDRTSADASEVAERRVTVVDFLASVYALLGIDARKRRTTPGGRRVPLVDLQTQEEPNVLKELF